MTVGSAGPGARQHRLEKQLLRHRTSQNPAAAQTKRRLGLSFLLAPSTSAPRSCPLCLPSQPHRDGALHKEPWEPQGRQKDRPLAGQQDQGASRNPTCVRAKRCAALGLLRQKEKKKKAEMEKLT